MRLKGGKVLINFGDITQSKELKLSSETTKAILEKGLILFVKYNDFEYVFEPLIQKINSVAHIITYQGFTEDDSGDVINIQLLCDSNILNLIVS